MAFFCTNPKKQTHRSPFVRLWCIFRLGLMLRGFSDSLCTTAPEESESQEWFGLAVREVESVESDWFILGLNIFCVFVNGRGPGEITPGQQVAAFLAAPIGLIVDPMFRSSMWPSVGLVTWISKGSVRRSSPVRSKRISRALWRV